ncbi:MAG: prepilin-type N-terminal cleavage/methylation domain-containing protein [Nitrospira sp.]
MRNSFAAYSVSIRGFTIIEVMVVVLILSVLAMLASTAFGRYRARSQQAEAATNLRGIFVTEIAYFADHKRFSNFRTIGFKIEGATNRYTYRAEETNSAGIGTGFIETIPAQIGLATRDNAVAAASSGIMSFTATATANIDSDGTLDEWHVTETPPETGSLDVNDVTQ